MSLLRIFAAIQQWSFLASLPGYSPLYIASTGLIWAVFGFFLFWGLWQGSPWAPRMAKPVFALFAGFYWFDRLFLSNREEGVLFNLPVNAGFAMVVTILSLGFSYWTLSRTTSNLFFGERHE